MSRVLGRIFSIFGLAVILVVILMYLPLSVPKLFSYDIHAVVSGSMEPTIPTWSLVYSKSCVASDLQEGNIIVFRSALEEIEGTVVTHRVVSNDTEAREIITKGDANNANDLATVPYTNVIGKVEKHIPYFGWIAVWLSDQTAKITIIGILIAAVLMRIAGGRLLAAGGSESDGKTKEAE